MTTHRKPPEVMLSPAQHGLARGHLTAGRAPGTRAHPRGGARHPVPAAQALSRGREQGGTDGAPARCLSLPTPCSVLTTKDPRSCFRL